MMIYDYAELEQMVFRMLTYTSHLLKDFTLNIIRGLIILFLLKQYNW